MNKSVLKSLILSAIFCFSLKATYGQNYTLNTLSIQAIGMPRDLLLPAVYVTNTSGQNLNMRFIRIVKDIPSGWTSCFCYPTCISPLQDTLDFTIPADSTQRISPNFGTDSIEGFGKVVLVLSEALGGKTDTLTFTGSTLQTTTGIFSKNHDNIQFYPNPTSDFLYLKGISDLNKIEIFNSNGVLLKTVNPTSTISIKELPSGIYIIRLMNKSGIYRSQKISKS